MRQRTITILTGQRHPLKQAEDAVLLDTTELDFQQSEEAILRSSARGRADERRRNATLLYVFPTILVATWICRLLHPVTVQGLENLPRHGALLVANHASNWDPLVLVTALPMDYRLRVMGKEELFRNPILAWVIWVGAHSP